MTAWSVTRSVPVSRAAPRDRTREMSMFGTPGPDQTCSHGWTHARAASAAARRVVRAETGLRSALPRAAHSGAAAGFALRRCC